MCRHFQEDYGLQVRIIRFHNVYGPYGTYDGGREKAPAAICRKIVEAKLNKKKKIEVWGDGKQTRSFCYVDDLINGFIKIMESNVTGPINLGNPNEISIFKDEVFVKTDSNHTVESDLAEYDKKKGIDCKSCSNITEFHQEYTVLRGVKKQGGPDETLNIS